MQILVTQVFQLYGGIDTIEPLSTSHCQGGKTECGFVGFKKKTAEGLAWLQCYLSHTGEPFLNTSSQCNRLVYRDDGGCCEADGNCESDVRPCSFSHIHSHQDLSQISCGYQRSSGGRGD